MHPFRIDPAPPYLLVKGTEDRLHIDLYSLAQTIYCFFPNRISFHKNQDGKVILKQELMATTNGIDPGDAHAAVDDVKTLLKLQKCFHIIDCSMSITGIYSIGGCHQFLL